MPYYPKHSVLPTSRDTLDTFGGLDMRERIERASFADMRNLSSLSYPLLAPRRRRGKLRMMQNQHPGGLIGKDTLCFIDNGELYIDQTKKTLSGVTISSGQKQLVGMGAYICIFPDGIFFNTEDDSDYGYMAAEMKIDAGTGSGISYMLCSRDGESLSATASATAPEEPEDGQYWIDTSGDTDTLKRYSAIYKDWTDIASSYIKISASGIDDGITAGDGITISGSSVPELNSSFVVTETGEDCIIVPGVLREVSTQRQGTLTLARKLPQMDYVCECGNRLWGCKYGTVDGETVNVLYASALGDFKNWNRFEGAAGDSWWASRGSDGAWTGCANYLGHPTFFKENCIEVIYPSESGAHRVVTTEVGGLGVARGSAASLAMVGSVLYYLSPSGVCAYTGTLPQVVSAAFGTEHFSHGVAGELIGRYYLSAMNSAGEWRMLVYDTSRLIWHIEDETQATAFARVGNELYFTDAAGNLWTVTGSSGAKEAPLTWYAESGVIGYYTPDRKYLSRFNIRAEIDIGERLEVWLCYDGDPEWVFAGSVTGNGMRTYTLAVPPRRCDHMRMRIVGEGDCRVWQIDNILAKGSDI